VKLIEYEGMAIGQGAPGDILHEAVFLHAGARNCRPEASRQIGGTSVATGSCTDS